MDPGEIGYAFHGAGMDYTDYFSNRIEEIISSIIICGELCKSVS